ncbi:MAG TPA: SDR family NAD(P)-dependent oxidoreductase, partial [Anaerolineae bacterium]|nr:SDR family NAD(P)-dependent oxidoreductase [Anaerolineae bacterium]
MYPSGTALAGRVAIVTGGASGIGEAVAKIFAANQCKVVLVDINNERLQNVAAEITAAGGLCRAVHADVTDESQVIKFFKDTVDEWDRLDLLVN